MKTLNQINEMNSSSTRASKNLLSQLHEATQSHQLAREESGIKTFFKPLKTGKNPKSKNKSLKQVSTEKRMCLVLLEEVEVVFEDDKFFWSAISTLMSTSKRPIILTSNDPNVAENIEGNFEKLTFQPPNTVQLCKYLHEIDCHENQALEGYSGMMLSSRIMKCDIRQSINTLHFWTGSISSNKDKPRNTAIKSKTSKRLSLGLEKENVCNGKKSIKWPEKPFSNEYSYIAGIKNYPNLSNCEDIFEILRSFRENENPEIMPYLESCIFHMHMHKLPQIIPLNWDYFLNMKLNEEIGKPLQIRIKYVPISNSDENNESIDLLALAEGFSKEKQFEEPNLPSKCINNQREDQSDLQKLKEVTKMLDVISTCDLLDASLIKLDQYPVINPFTCSIKHALDCNNVIDDDSCYKTEAAISETKAFLQVHALSVCKFNSTRKSDEIIDNNAHNKLKISDKLKRKEYGNFFANLQKQFDTTFTTQPSAFILDTVPSLRSICREQDIKERSKFKRRFLHYFHSLSIHPKEHHMKKLTTDFQEVYYH